MSYTVRTSATGLEPIDRTTLVAMIDLCIDADQPILIYGTPGIAKSETAREITERKGYALLDVRAGNIPPEDFAGIAWPDQQTKRVERLMPDVVSAAWALHEKAGKPVVIFLDEINHCAHAAQGPLYSIVLERQAAGYPLPPGTRIIAAGNPEGSGSISEEMSRALLDRFLVVEYAGPTPSEFSNYADSVSLNPIIRAFLKERPDLLNAFDAEAHVSPTPRSWSRLGRVFDKAKDSGLMMQAAFSLVGMEVGNQLAAFVEMFGEVPTFDEVVADPAKARLPEKFSARYMTALTIAARLVDFWKLEDGRYCTSTDADDKQMRVQVHAAVTAYIMRLPAELQAACVTALQHSETGMQNVMPKAMVGVMLTDYRQAAPGNVAAFNTFTTNLKEMVQGITEISLP